MQAFLSADEIATIDRHFGAEDALDNVDSVLVILILDYIRRSPSTNRRIDIALQAIASLSQHDPSLARSLMQEMVDATF